MPGGRPSKLRPEVAERIIEAVEAGASLRVTAAYAGIAQSTLLAWLAKAEEDGARGEFVEFSERVGAARSGLFVRLGQTAIAGAMKDPRLALSSMRALFAADLDPPRVGVEVSGQLAVHHDDPGPGGPAARPRLVRADAGDPRCPVPRQRRPRPRASRSVAEPAPPLSTGRPRAPSRPRPTWPA
jgi:hypothetical protein